MSSSEDEHDVALEHLYQAIRIYAKLELSNLVKQTICKLQCVPASGSYGKAYIFKTLWDEYCHEVQEGLFVSPESECFPTSAWDEANLVINDLVDNIPNYVLRLFSIYAVRELEIKNAPPNYTWPDTVIYVLKAGLDERAGGKDLTRFSPFRNG